MVTFFKKWWAFFFPLPGWKERYLAYRKGKQFWEVPGRPEAPKIIGIPIEWICVDLENLPTEDDVTRGFSFRSITCVDTGLQAPAGEGARCLRCGVDLHVDAAHMIGPFDPPACWRCHWLIR